MSVVQTDLPIRVNNPRKLKAWSIPCERMVVGDPGDYKPTMTLLPNGELVMVAFCMQLLDNERRREPALLWRSSDGGKTWSPRRVLEDVIGREQWLTCTRDGTLFMTSHLLHHDIENPDGYCHSYLHRSTDGGQTWQRQRIDLKGDDRHGAKIENGTFTSRNFLELPNDTLLLGVSPQDSNSAAYLWSSQDGGKRGTTASRFLCRIIAAKRMTTWMVFSAKVSAIVRKAENCFIGFGAGLVRYIP